MLGPRDALIAQLAKQLGLATEGGIARATDLKKRFPQRALEQILVDMGMLDKPGYAKLAAAFAQQQKSGGAAPSKPGVPPKPTPAKPKSSRAPSPDEASDDGMIVPDDEDQKALARRNAAGRGSAPIDPLATPGSDDLTSSSDVSVTDEDEILAEPTIVLRDERGRPAPERPVAPSDEEAILAEPTLMMRDDDGDFAGLIPGATAGGQLEMPPSDEEAILAEPTLRMPVEETRKAPPSRPGPTSTKRIPRPVPQPSDEEAILAEPTLMMPDEELKQVPARKSKSEPKLRPQTEEEILAEPTLMVPDDDSPVRASGSGRLTQEEAILSEPTLMLGDRELQGGAPETSKAPPRDFVLEIVPSDESAVMASGGFFTGEPPPAGDMVAGGSPSEPKGPQPGVKKKTKGGALDRKEFERRSKLRMNFEGLHIGDYEIVGELSRGAFGVVLKVRPEASAKTMARERGFDGEFMAMKVMLETNDPEETRRFMDEVKVLIELVHPNIIRIFDAGVEKGLKYYTMELIQGVDSRTLVREQGGKLPVLYAVRIAKDVAAALAIVHAQTIYHRDLKPANVMIDRKSQPYRTVLIDFGLVTKKKEGQKDDGLILGTPSYMPPEQAKPKGGFGEVNGTSDIYSLGATFYFLMTGQSPFPGKDPREIIKRVCTEPPPSPLTLNAEIPKSIAAIAMKCLAKVQRERYPGARVLEQELERELNAAQLKLKAKGFVRKLFGGGSSPPAKS